MVEEATSGDDPTRSAVAFLLVADPVSAWLRILVPHGRDAPPGLLLHTKPIVGRGLAIPDVALELPVLERYPQFI